MSESRQLTIKQVKPLINRCFETKRPIMLWGSPGLGKSNIIADITDSMEGLLIDMRVSQLDPTDLRGVPYFDKDQGVMNWAPPIELPSEELASKYPVVVLFLDELNGGTPSVLAACYQLILDRKIGTYKLPDNVVMIAAGNKESDKGVTFRMPTPLSNRFVHAEMKVDFDSWLDWAVENNINKDIVGYLTFAKQDLFDFDPKSVSRSFATPRSWEFVSQLIDDTNMPNEVITNLVAGTIGEGLALKFMAHRKIASKMPNPVDILSGKVKTLDTDEISAMFSLVISMCYELKEENDKKLDTDKFHVLVDNFLGFMMDNFTSEITVMGIRVALTTYKLPILPTKLKNFDSFHSKFGKYITQAND